MPEFIINTHRSDPYRTLKFRVLWDNKVIPGIFRVSPLRRSTDILYSRDGGDLNTLKPSPGKTGYEPLLLERGRTHDTAFEEWTNKVFNRDAGPGEEISLRDYRKDVSIQFMNEAGQVAMAFVVTNCWPRQYTALGPLDALNPEVAVESLLLEHEGWSRDLAVTEPTEVSKRSAKSAKTSKTSKKSPRR